MVESVQEREQRIERLESERARRRSQEPVNEPVEIAPGRGDLRFSSQVVATEPMLGGGNLWPGLWWSFNVSFAEIFQTQPWVAAAVMRMLTWSIRVPLKVYERLDDNERRRLHQDEHPLAAAVVNPWNRGSQAQLIMNLLGPVLVHGNSLTHIEDGAGESLRFAPKDWRYSRPITPWRDAVEGFVFDVDNSRFSREVSIDEILHVAWWSPMGPLGTSPLQQLGVSLNIETNAQLYQASLFKNGARPPSALTTSDEFLGLERDERTEIMQQLREDVDKIYGGPNNAGKPALLPPGLDWKPVGHSAVEAELIDQRKIARDEISAVYLIPPPMMGILDKATYSNIETQRQMVYTECVGPPLILIEQALNAQVVRDMLGLNNIYVEFDFAGVLRGDQLKEIEALREAIGNALLTPNEGRTILNRPTSDLEEMDQFYLPFNNLSPIQNPATPQPRTRQEDRQRESQSRGGVIVPAGYDRS